MDLGSSISSWVSTGTLVLLAYGLVHRHRPRIHIPVMVSAFAIDVANVIFIEVRRSAVEKALQSVTTGGDWLLKFHIAVSLLSVAGYLVALFTGLRLYRRGEGRQIHRANAIVFIVNRVLNYLTSFYV
jgi:formate-dependent nitrite reductase membrane component NrfD